MATLLPLNVFMLVVFWWKTGVKSYLIISGVTTVGWLSFVLIVLKRGYMLGSRMAIAREDNPLKFWANVGFLLLGYALMLFLSVGLYLQETGHLARK